jgi:hypothetical protein
LVISRRFDCRPFTGVPRTGFPVVAFLLLPKDFLLLPKDWLGAFGLACANGVRAGDVADVRLRMDGLSATSAGLSSTCIRLSRASRN